MSGKGSKPRPFSVSQEEYDSRWDAIFGRDQPKEPEAIVEGQLPSEEEIIESPQQSEDCIDEDADRVCPECRSDLVPTLMYTRIHEPTGFANHRYCYKCHDCGYVGDHWDVIDA